MNFCSYAATPKLTKSLASKTSNEPLYLQDCIISLEGCKVTLLTVYDGANGIGGNKINLEDGGKGGFLCESFWGCE
jgi:hypothetical protein